MTLAPESSASWDPTRAETPVDAAPAHDGLTFAYAPQPQPPQQLPTYSEYQHQLHDGPWQRPRDDEGTRHEVLAQIARVLDGAASSYSAVELEAHLYRSARSRAEYADLSTVTERLRGLVHVLPRGIRTADRWPPSKHAHYRTA